MYCGNGCFTINQTSGSSFFRQSYNNLQISECVIKSFSIQSAIDDKPTVSTFKSFPHCNVQIRFILFSGIHFYISNIRKL